MRPVVLVDQNVWFVFVAGALVVLAVIGVALLILKPMNDKAQRDLAKATQDHMDARQAELDGLLDMRENIKGIIARNADEIVADGPTNFLQLIKPAIDSKVRSCTIDGIQGEEAWTAASEFVRPLIEIFADLAGHADETKRHFVQQMVGLTFQQLRLAHLKELERQYTNT